MKKIRTFIVEDDSLELSLIKMYLAEKCPQVEVIGEHGIMEEAIKQIVLLKPNLIFIDIEIIAGSGYTLLDKLNKANLDFGFQVIFMTGHKSYEYATQAFDYAALDFLSKPLSADRLKIAVDRCIEKEDASQNVKQIEFFTQLMKLKDVLPDRMAVYLVKNEFEIVNIKDIMYVENDKTMSDFNLSNGDILKSVRNVHKYESLLIPHNFFLIREGILVNAAYIKRYKHSEKEVVMTNGTKLSASKKGGQDLKDFWVSGSILDRIKRFF